MTMYDGRTNLSRQVIDQVERHLPQMLYKTVIPRSIRAGEAPSFGHTILNTTFRSCGGRLPESSPGIHQTP